MRNDTELRDGILTCSTCGAAMPCRGTLSSKLVLDQDACALGERYAITLARPATFTRYDLLADRLAPTQIDQVIPSHNRGKKQTYVGRPSSKTP